MAPSPVDVPVFGGMAVVQGEGPQSRAGLSSCSGEPILSWTSEPATSQFWSMAEFISLFLKTLTSKQSLKVLEVKSVEGGTFGRNSTFSRC